MIVNMDLYSQIRTLYTQGESIRAIARKLGVSRQTVKKYCEGSTHPDVRKPYDRKPDVMTDEIKLFILNCLRLDEEENLSKQKHTAKRIYDRLVHERKFIGSYSAVRETVKLLKGNHLVPGEADIPLEYDPGDAVQIDWGSAVVYLNGLKLNVNLFCGRLCNSCDIFVQAYFSQNQESFLEAIQCMFDHFMGIPRRAIFDNAKIAVKEGFGLHAKATDGYKAFAAHYAFTPEFCNIASGNEKGLVENLVGFARRNFLVPVPRVSSLVELNANLLASCLNYRNIHQVESRTQSVKDAFAMETRFLAQIPSFRFDTSRTATPSVNDYSTVRFDKNNYSVPVRFLRKSVTVKGYANDVHIFYGGEMIAHFDRLYGSKKTSYRLEHYIDLLERKPRAVFQAKPVRTNISKQLFEWGQLLPGGNAEMVRLLRLCVDHGEEKILSILSQLPKSIIPTVDLVRSYLYETPEHKLLHLNNEVPVTVVDLRKYDEKCGVAK